MDKKIGINTVTQQIQRMKCAGVIREWKSTLQAFDVTLLNMARILDKRHVLSSCCFMFQTW